MSAFKQSMGKLGVRAGLLAGASAAVLAISGISAGSAMAAPPNCPNPGSSIHGKGSSLQKIAMETWTAKYHADCPSGATVTYESTGSGPGLEAFGFTGAHKVNRSFQYVGSDDAPNEEQIGKAEEASKKNEAGEVKFTGARPVIVPVSQTAIAVVVNLPENCAFTAGTGITWKDLNKVFGGSTIKEWSQFENIHASVAGACNHEITRVVRAEGSGTSLQFKNYLSTLETERSAETLPCTTEGHTTWAQLEEVGTNEKPNKTWPQCVGNTTPIITGAGGGKLVEEVAAHDSSIGYAALPDAEAHLGTTATIVPLQNHLTGTEAEYLSPANTTTKTARCVNARYTVPAGAQSTGSGIAVNWSTTFGAQPNIGGANYPLCTLTYDIGWTNYTNAGYSTPTVFQEDVVDWIKEYLVQKTLGQTDIVGKWYSAMPNTGVASTDVQVAAEHSAAAL